MSRPLRRAARENDRLLVALQRLEGLARSLPSGNAEADHRQALSLADDLNRLVAQLQRRRDEIRADLDGISGHMTAIGAYGRAAQLTPRR